MTETPNLKIPHGGYVVVGDGRRPWCCATRATRCTSPFACSTSLRRPPTRRRASRARTGRPASGRGSTAAPSNRRIGTRSPRSASRTRSRRRWTASPMRSRPDRRRPAAHARIVAAGAVRAPQARRHRRDRQGSDQALDRGDRTPSHRWVTRPALRSQGIRRQGPIRRISADPRRRTGREPTTPPVRTSCGDRAASRRRCGTCPGSGPRSARPRRGRRDPQRDPLGDPLLGAVAHMPAERHDTALDGDADLRRIDHGCESQRRSTCRRTVMSSISRSSLQGFRRSDGPARAARSSPPKRWRPSPAPAGCRSSGSGRCP